MGAAKNPVLARKLVDKARTYEGIKYRYGAEPSLSEEPPKALDCSELIERVFKLVDGAPKLPDGSRYQAASSLTKKCSTEEALNTVAALLFITKNGKHSGVNHVGLSCGDGTVIEANGGIGRVVRRKPRAGYWSYGAKVKGVHY